MSRYLQRIAIDRYGALSDCEVGPFGPGLNVVYGPNEAGKSTLASFVGGVLFGWEEARGVRNTYRPPEGERGGSLVFAERRDVPLECDTAPDANTPGLVPDANAPGSRPTAVVSRRRNEDGLQGDPGITADIDHATYRTMFSLTSDELRSLHATSDIAARLLTAGAGTGASPSAAFVEVEQRIAALTARDPDAEGSVFALRAALDAKRGEIDAAREANDLHLQEDRELAALTASQETAGVRLAALNDEVERLGAAAAQVEELDAHMALREGDVAALAAERADLADLAYPGPDAAEASGSPISPQLVGLDASDERSLLDKLDEYADAQAKAMRSVEAAREASETSEAAFEALDELDEQDGAGGASAGRGSGLLRARKVQVALSIAMPVAFVVAGIPLGLHGVQIRSLSFVALGVGLVVFAAFLAAAALAMMLRPDSAADNLARRRQDAKWVMLQDRKKLESSLASKDQLDREVEAFLARNGLADAKGSIRQARLLLDDAREVRQRIGTSRQRLAAVDVRMGKARAELATLQSKRAAALRGAGMPETASLHQLRAALAERSEQRDALSAAVADMSRRAGELTQALADARDDRSFDACKLEYHQLRCRMRGAKHDLVTLLLAKRILEKSIAAWESRSQPEVYAQASRIFSEMTGGAWARVAMTAEGRLVAVAADGTSREVRHLSVGTCQQLYLSLRVAMLMHAESVGRSIPVIADDILVNFDEGRRRACARVLAELADMRQVIVFTCHRETVDVLRAAADITYIEL